MYFSVSPDGSHGNHAPPIVDIFNFLLQAVKDFRKATIGKTSLGQIVRLYLAMTGNIIPAFCLHVKYKSVDLFTLRIMFHK